MSIEKSDLKGERDRMSFFFWVKNQVELTFIEKTKADHELQKEGHQVEPLQPTPNNLLQSLPFWLTHEQQYCPCV